MFADFKVNDTWLYGEYRLESESKRRGDTAPFDIPGTRPGIYVWIKKKQ